MALKLWYISSRFFENEPSENYSHLSEKGPKGRFLRRKGSEITLAKEKERKEEIEGARTEKKGKDQTSSGYTLSFYISLDEKGLLGSNVFKNSIYIQQINSRKVVIGKLPSETVRDMGRGRFTAA